MSAAAVSHFSSRSGHVLCNTKQNVLWQHVVGGLIVESRNIITPLKHLFEHKDLIIILVKLISPNYHVIVDVFGRWFLINFQANSC